MIEGFIKTVLDPLFRGESIKPDPVLTKQSASFLVLEPRIMFDGAGFLLDDADDSGLDSIHDLADTGESQHGNDAAHQFAQAVYGHLIPETDQRREILFIDPGVKEYQKLLAGASPDHQVVVLDANQDGIQQIADVLANLGQFDAIHILSHGDDAQVTLGKSTLSQENIDTYSETLNRWGEALQPDGDILFYGCDVGAGEKGADFVSRLKEITGADIATSEDLTGSEEKGGDWDLERTKGSIETDIFFDATATRDYEGILATAASATNLDAAKAYSEGAAAFSLADIVVTDPDAGDTITATLTLSDEMAGTLSTATSGDVTSTFNGTVWTASGVLADVNTLLAGVTFTPATDYDQNFTIATSVGDGVAAAVTGTKNVTVTPVSDAPLAGMRVFDFDGVNDDIQASLGTGTFSTDITMETWVKFDDLTGKQAIMKVGELSGPTNEIYSMYKDTDNSINVWAGGDGPSLWVGSVATTLNADQWYHVAFTHDGVNNVARLYLDGVNIYSDTSVAAFALDNVNQEVVIGQEWAGGTNWLSDAHIADVRVWGDVRTLAEISDNKNTRLVGSESDLVGYWKLDETSGTSAVDSSGNSYNGTISGMNLAWDSVVTSGFPLNTETMSVGSSSNLTINLDAYDPDNGSSLTYTVIDATPNNGALYQTADGVTLGAILTDNTVVSDSQGRIIFVPTANYSGTDNALTFKANDTTNDSNTATLNLVVKNAPTAAINTVSTNEDTAYALTAADFNFSDLDAGDALTKVKITTLESAGALTHTDTGAVTLNQEITRADIDLGKLIFTPAANASGAGHDTFGFKVHDGIEYSVAAYTMTVDVTVVNDAPIVRDVDAVLDFDGVDDNFIVSDLGTFTDITLEHWVKLDALPVSGELSQLFGEETWASGALHTNFFYDGSNYSLKFSINENGTGNLAEFTYDFSQHIGDWIHIALSLDATANTLDLYLNGRLQESKAYDPAVSIVATTTSI